MLMVGHQTGLAAWSGRVTAWSGRVVARFGRVVARFGRVTAPGGLVVLGGAVITLQVGVAACGSAASAGQECEPATEALPATAAWSLIAEIPRTSAAAASLALREVAQLLPYLPADGLQLHVIYSQDSDDLVPGGGDGGPPQVLYAAAPSFAAVQVSGAPARPADPTHLTSQRYCGQLTQWEHRAQQELQSTAAQRSAAVATWLAATERRLTQLAGRPIPDTSGAEAGGEVDTAASVFAAVQVAQAASQPTIFLVGGLSILNPPTEQFRFRGQLIALIDSDDPGQVLPAEAKWTQWAHAAGASFEALSADDAPATIAQALGPRGR
jgi:hypothetical protein